MEAKIDIRKLQVLNDRLVQAIEALNQVRMSVYGATPGPVGFGGGLSHTGAFPTMGGMGMGMGMGGGYPGLQQFGQNPWQQGGYGMQTQNPGMFQTNPWQQQQQQPYGFGGGLFHTAVDQIEQRANDPYRIAQTFPLLGAWINQMYQNQNPNFGQGLGQVGQNYPVNPTW